MSETASSPIVKNRGVGPQLGKAFPAMDYSWSAKRFLERYAHFAHEPQLRRVRWSWGLFFLLWAGLFVCAVGIGYALSGAFVQVWAWYSLGFTGLMLALLRAGRWGQCTRCGGKLDEKLIGDSVSQWLVSCCAGCQRYAYLYQEPPDPSGA